MTIRFGILTLNGGICKIILNNTTICLTIALVKFIIINERRLLYEQKKYWCFAGNTNDSLPTW